MPVEDTPVHSHGQRSTYRAGCYNRKEVPEGSGYWARDGYLDVLGGEHAALVRFIWVPFQMSSKCRQLNELPECVGCTAPKDTEYIDKMKGLT